MILSYHIEQPIAFNAFPCFNNATFLFLTHKALYKNAVSWVHSTFDRHSINISRILANEHTQIIKITVQETKRSLYLVDLILPNPETTELENSKTLAILKKIRSFLVSIMNDQEPYLIEKKLA